MKLEDQCITLIQAQTLEELGIIQESAFHWVHNGAGWNLMPEGYFYLDPEGGESFAAFNVAELGYMLPTDIPDGSGASYAYYHRKNWRGHSVGYSMIVGKEHIEAGWHQLERSARYDLLTVLISSGRMTVENLNTMILANTI
jgi:hypothetical protein